MASEPSHIGTELVMPAALHRFVAAEDPSCRVLLEVEARQKENVLGLSWLNNVFTGMQTIWNFVAIGGKMRNERLFVPQLGDSGSKL